VIRSLRHRYHLLLALRWLPVGLFMTVFVLLMRSRGLSLAAIGVATATQGLVMLVLELPSGGLADALGRKPVLLVASALSILSVVLLLPAHGVGLVAVVFAIQGVSRALDSGPLQSWFVDAALVADPGVDLERELGRAGVVICGAIGAGAILASGIVRAGGIGLPPLVAPIVVGLVVQAVGLVALVALMDERRPGRGWAAAGRSVGAVPAVMGGALRTIRASSLLAALVAAELLWGVGMVAFERFFPPRLAELGPGADAAAGLVGPAVAAAWVLSAAGAACGPVLVRRFGAARAGCGLRFVHGAVVVGMGLAGAPAVLIAAYLASYWAHGATDPVHYGMVHRAARSEERATVVSANSLASQVGGAASGIALGALADAAGIGTAMVVAGVVLAASAPLYLAGRTRERDRERDRALSPVGPPAQP
jgi:predicted MFS family arabinose efflux permease